MNKKERVIFLHFSLNNIKVFINIKKIILNINGTKSNKNQMFVKYRILYTNLYVLLECATKNVKYHLSYSMSNKLQKLWR